MALPEQTIKSVIPLHVGQFMFARMETEQGIVGYGEAGIWGHIEAAATAIKRFAEYLVGKPAFTIEYHWNVMHRFSYFQGLAISSHFIHRYCALGHQGKSAGSANLRATWRSMQHQSSRVWSHL